VRGVFQRRQRTGTATTKPVRGVFQRRQRTGTATTKPVRGVFSVGVAPG
jgi:hypothetical protein